MSRTIKFTQAGGQRSSNSSKSKSPLLAPAKFASGSRQSGINRADSMWRNKSTLNRQNSRQVLGYEAAGIVDAVGKDVTGFAAVTQSARFQPSR